MNARSAVSLLLTGSMIIIPLSASLKHNTTTPALQHILGHKDYTDDQLTFFLHDDHFVAEQPFPLALRIIQINITRLRHQVATGTTTSEAVSRIISGLFDRLGGIDLAEWVQKIAGFDATTNQALAETYRDAIWLYAILALPQPAMQRWASEQPPLAQSLLSDIDAYNYVRSLYTSRLLAALRSIFPCLPYLAAAGEALVIAGVAVASCGGKEDQEFVDQGLHAIWLLPVGSGAIALRLQKLREFWASGKTGWEDCFYEPTPG